MLYEAISQCAELTCWAHDDAPRMCALAANPGENDWRSPVANDRLHADQDLFLSTLVLGEIRKAVELARPRDLAKAVALERWLLDVEVAFSRRVLGIDKAVSDQWGRLSAIRSLPAIDGLLAATALTNGLTLVTRNDRDVAGLGAAVFNPFKGAESEPRS
jgi:predicted nucleic acid-binding protein